MYYEVNDKSIIFSDLNKVKLGDYKISLSLTDSQKSSQTYDLTFNI